MMMHLEHMKTIIQRCAVVSFFIGELPFLTVLKSIVIIIAIFEDGATDRTGDVREAFPSGDGGGCTVYIIV